MVKQKISSYIILNYQRLFIRYNKRFNENGKYLEDLVEYIKSGESLNTLYSENCLLNLVDTINSYARVNSFDLDGVKILKNIFNSK